MAVPSFCGLYGALRVPILCLMYVQCAIAISGSVYRLDTEYSGANFFQGWDFFTGGDPTGGFVTYTSQNVAQNTGLINASDTSPIYIGTDYTTTIGSLKGFGRPTVRISTKRSWTHGLFIGDFNHAPGGVCGTWPAFWTLAPNWPNNGEIDIMEGANLLSTNAVTLHSSVNCTIAGDSRTQTGSLQNNNCAYYPGYNVGCGVKDTRSSSYGVRFNSNGGGVYAMQWTSDYIRVWMFPRGSIPADITNKTPNPSSWGLPAANMQGSCLIDNHFQGHKVILNNALCGEYAGVDSVWGPSTGPSCKATTGYPNCTAYTAAVPGGFQNAYWSISSVRVYQLVDASTGIGSNTTSAYIASNQPTQTTTVSATSAVVTLASGASSCPVNNFTIVQYGNYQYEVECGYNIQGNDLGVPSGVSIKKFEDCIAACSYWNTNSGMGTCGGVTYNVNSNACYPKGYIAKSGGDVASAGYNSARFIFYAYPQITDDPRTSTSASTAYVAITVTPQYYVTPNATTTSSFALITETPTSNVTDAPGGLGGGDATDTGVSGSISGSRTYTGSRTRSSSSLSSVVSSLASPSSTLASSTPFPITTTAPTSMSSSTAASSTMSSTGGQLSPRSTVASSSPTSATTAVVVLSTTSVAGAGQSSSLSISHVSSSLILSSPVVATTSTVRVPTTSSSTVAQSSSAASTSASGSSVSTALLSSSTVIYTTATSQPQPPVPSSSNALSTTVSISPTATTAQTVTSASTDSNMLTSSIETQGPTSTTSPPQESSSITILSTSDTGSTTTTTSEVLLGPTEVVTPDGTIFSLAGCLGPKPGTPFANSFTLADDYPGMDVTRCTADCASSIYFGLFSTQCYCSSYSSALSSSTNANSDSDFIEYPASACNTTCPGDPTQKCGGVVDASPSPGGLMKRQIANAQGDRILLTLYNNTIAAAAAIQASSSSTTISSMTSTSMAGASDGGVLASTTVSTSASAATSIASPLLVSTTQSSSSMITAAGSSTGSGQLTDNPVLGSTTTSTLPISSPPDSSSTSHTLSPILISTVYTTICALDDLTCPIRTETCLSTTITVMHCGCTDIPEPTVPMTTTIVEACPTSIPDTSPNGDNEQSTPQEAGNAAPLPQPAMTTLSIPCTESIAALQAQVTAYAAASASTQAAANAPPSPATKNAPPSPSDTNAHAPVPYSFPIDFPMTTQTRELWVATAPYNFSVPLSTSTALVNASAGNLTWHGDVLNVTVLPVALSAIQVSNGAIATATAGARIGEVSPKKAGMERVGVGMGDLVVYGLGVWLWVLL